MADLGRSRSWLCPIPNAITAALLVIRATNGAYDVSSVQQRVTAPL